MADNAHRIVGIFTAPDGVRRGLAGLRDAGLGGGTVYSPMQARAIEAETGRARGFIGLFALTGALAGAATGLILTAGTSVEVSLVTGGQPIVSLPPFLIIIFELTVLFGVLGTVLGMIGSIRRGRGQRTVYDPRFSSDRFGLAVECNDDRFAIARDLLMRAGAEEVRDEKY